MSIAETLKANVVFVVLTTAVASFGTGWGAYKAVLEAQKQGSTARPSPEKSDAGACPAVQGAQPSSVDLLAVFNMGRSIANAEASALSAPKSAQDSLNGAIQNAERICVLKGETKQAMYQAAGALPQQAQLNRIVDLVGADLAPARK